MKTSKKTLPMLGRAVVTLFILGGAAGLLQAREHNSASDPNDPTHRLFALLDDKFGGKLDSFYVLADLVPDPTAAGQQLQRIVEIDYGKDRGFGKLNLHVRSVAPLTPDQLKAYTTKQLFDFAVADSEKFIKTDSGPFGRPGDVYFQSTADNGALASTTINSQVQSDYDTLVSQYLIPALEKKAAEGPAATP